MAEWINAASIVELAQHQRNDMGGPAVHTYSRQKTTGQANNKSYVRPHNLQISKSPVASLSELAKALKCDETSDPEENDGLAVGGGEIESLDQEAIEQYASPSIMSDVFEEAAGATTGGSVIANSDCFKITEEDLALRDGPTEGAVTASMSRIQCPNCDKELVGLDSQSLLSEHSKSCKAKGNSSVQYLCNICHSIFRTAREVKKDVAKHYELQFLKCLKCIGSPDYTFDQMTVHLRESHYCQKNPLSIVWVVDTMDAFTEQQSTEFKKLLNENISRIVPVQDENNSPAVNLNPINNPPNIIPPPSIQEDSKDLLMSIVAQGEELTEIKPMSIDVYLRFGGAGHQSNMVWCRLCSNGFSKLHLARSHVAAHIQENEQGLSLSRNDMGGGVFGRSSKMRMFCSQCKLFFENPNSLLAHVNGVHKNAQMQTYHMCCVCSEMYKDKWACVDHLEKTHYASPVQCNICDEYLSCPENGFAHFTNIHNVEPDLSYVDDDKKRELVLEKITQLQRPPLNEVI